MYSLGTLKFGSDGSPDQGCPQGVGKKSALTVAGFTGAFGSGRPS